MLKTLDLFSGIGGFSIGLERAGFETVAFCEIDKYCGLVLKKHWKDIKVYPDVREITKRQLEEDGCELPEVITGGFPCQPFSVAGRQKGSGDNRYLWPQMFRVIKEFKPRWIIAENVRGIINIQHGMVFERVHTDLESQGYETQTFIIPAAGVGAPHRRDRVWIVANSRRTIRGQQSSRNKESIESGTSQETKRSADSDSLARSGKGEKIMADSNINREKWNQSENRKGSRIKQSSKDVADSSSIQSRKPSESEGRKDSSRGSIDSRGNKNKRTEVVADSSSIQSDGRGRSNDSIKEQGQKQAGGTSGSVANTNSERGRLRNTQRQNAKDVRKSSQGQRHGWWDIEPDVGRVADGVQGRIHRLKGLGNSIVPQIAEEIGKAIMKVELDSD